MEEAGGGEGVAPLLPTIHTFGSGTSSGTTTSAAAAAHAAGDASSSGAPQESSGAGGKRKKCVRFAADDKLEQVRLFYKEGGLEEVEAATATAVEGERGESAAAAATAGEGGGGESSFLQARRKEFMKEREMALKHREELVQQREDSWKAAVAALRPTVAWRPLQPLVLPPPPEDYPGVQSREKDIQSCRLRVTIESFYLRPEQIPPAPGPAPEGEGEEEAAMPEEIALYEVPHGYCCHLSLFLPLSLSIYVLL
jgi:hypothetical protein